MTSHQPPHRPLIDPDELEPGLPPIDPDEGMVPPIIPDDPEHDRVVDPAL